jgi:hypothetical protein
MDIVAGRVWSNERRPMPRRLVLIVLVLVMVMRTISLYSATKALRQTGSTRSPVNKQVAG